MSITEVGMLVCASLFSIGLILVLVHSNKNTKLIRQDMKALDSQVKMMVSGSVGLGQRIILLESKLRKVNESQDKLKESDLAFSFTQAQRLIDQGASADLVATQSGLSQSEIQLMLLLKRQGEERVAVQ